MPPEGRKTRTVWLGRVPVGGGHPPVVQSMLNTDSTDYQASLQQARRLEELGCEVIRLAVPNKEAAVNASALRDELEMPVVADIHFNHRLALRVMELGIDGLRINPGNIGGREKVQEVAALALKKGVPIRVGVNAGSLEGDLLEKYGHPTAEAMVESALSQLKLLEAMGCEQLLVSLKSSSVPMTLRAYRLMAEKCDYPFHIGITEAGTSWRGTIVSSVGLGILLEEGLGATLRVSLTATPEEEVRVAWEILKALELRERGPTVISCPTCGRTGIDLISLAREVEERVAGIEKPLKIAVMGCEVNGPGEAREADIGIAGGKNSGLIFSRGQVIKRVPAGKLVEELLQELEGML